MPWSAVIDRREVQLVGDSHPAGSARWVEGRLEAITPPCLLGEAEQAALEAELRRDEESSLAAAETGAFDDEGVDLSLIRWMLSPSPAERLAVLESNNAMLCSFVR